MLVLIVLWPSELEGIGVNMIISVGLLVPVPNFAGYPFGYLGGIRGPWSSLDALLEHLKGSRVLGLIIFTYILIQCNLAPVTKVATQQYTILLTVRPCDNSQLA